MKIRCTHRGHKVSWCVQSFWMWPTGELNHLAHACRQSVLANDLYFRRVFVAHGMILRLGAPTERWVDQEVAQP